MYKLVLKLRNSYYNKYKAYEPFVPSVCVGNITVGGTGKTPQVEMIIRYLLADEKWGNKNIAVVSRGYKRSSKGFQQVVPNGSAEMFGDEPLQIKRKFPNVTVVVDKDRVEACDLLCNPEKMSNPKVAKTCWYRDFPKADFIIFDDAFQYRKLRAARTLVLVDYNRPIFKDNVLPWGRLRDLKERIQEADLVVVTKSPVELENREEFVSKLGVDNVIFSSIRYSSPEPAFNITEPRYLYAQKVVMATGIAKDTPLRNYLSANYKIVKRFSFPDHHAFTWSDINAIQNIVSKDPTVAIMTTEKDLPRFMDFKGLPDSIKQRLFTVPIESYFENSNDNRIFEETIIF